jgi:hypothetical protein
MTLLLSLVVSLRLLLPLGILTLPPLILFALLLLVVEDSLLFGTQFGCASSAPTATSITAVCILRVDDDGHWTL